MGKKQTVQRLDYARLLGAVKNRIRQSQARAALAVNAELIRLYWNIGRILDERQSTAGWGAAVIPRLARDLHHQLPDLKGFSERNFKRMLAFYRAYPAPHAIVPQPVAQLPSPPKVPQAVAQFQPVKSTRKTAAPSDPSDDPAEPALSLLWSIPWGHHALLLDKIKECEHRVWYMEQTIQHGWSRETLGLMIRSRAHARRAKMLANFSERLPPQQSELVIEALKDPYVFDFLTLEEPFHERELEIGLLQHLERFLLELGRGFAFVGRQYPLNIGGDEYFIDLLFYHLRLRCYVVIDLKKGAFKPEYAGKMNFYLNVVDDQLRHTDDAPSVGLILCQDRNRIAAEYAVRGMNRPIGVSEYELTRALPREFRSSLPTIAAIEAELATVPKERSTGKAAQPRRRVSR